MKSIVTQFSGLIRAEYDNGNVQTFRSVKQLAEEIRLIERAKLQPYPLWNTVTKTVRISWLLKAGVQVVFEKDYRNSGFSWVTIKTGSSMKRCFEFRPECHNWKRLPDNTQILEIFSSPIVTTMEISEGRATVSFVYPIEWVHGYESIRSEILACLERAIEELTEQCPVIEI